MSTPELPVESCPIAVANSWRVKTVKTLSNGEMVLVMSDGTRETWTRRKEGDNGYEYLTTPRTMIRTI
jgi:hypothetical protein